MNLVCVTKTEVALIASVYFVGAGLGCLTSFTLADKWGRRKTTIFAFGCHLLG